MQKNITRLLQTVASSKSLLGGIDGKKTNPDGREFDTGLVSAPTQFFPEKSRAKKRYIHSKLPIGVKLEDLSTHPFSPKSFFTQLILSTGDEARQLIQLPKLQS
jgi:hypothetical protein